MNDLVNVIEAIVAKALEKLDKISAADLVDIRRIAEMVIEAIPADSRRGNPPLQDQVDLLTMEIRDLRGRFESLQAQFDGLMSEEG